MDLLTTARVVISLAVVLAVIWFLSRRFRGNAAAQRARSRVQLLGKTGVGGKASVVVVEAEGMRLVLGVTEHGVSVLHSADAPAAEPALAPVAPLAPAAARPQASAGDERVRPEAPLRDPNAAALAPRFRSRDAGRAASHVGETPSFSAALAAQFKALIQK